MTKAIKWKDKFEPKLVLNELKKYIEKNGETTSYNPFKFKEYSVILETMLDFGTEISAQDRHELTYKTIDLCAKDVISSDNFLTKINKLYDSLMSDKSKEFYLVSNISIQKPFNLELKLDDCNIHITSDLTYIKKFSSRYTLLNSSDKLDMKEEDEFCTAVVTGKFKNENLAVEKCIDILALFRAFLCIDINPEISIRSNIYSKPINEVTLGKFKTLHDKCGELVTDTKWFSSNYKKIKPFRFKNQEQEKIINNIRSLCKKYNLFSKGDKRILVKTITRFVEAFDHTDHLSSIISGWGSLEYLITRGDTSKNERIITICSSIYTDFKLHEQIIKCIREFRNKYVHYGLYNTQPDTICYLLQRYFYNMIGFYLDNIDNKKYNSIDEMNDFLYNKLSKTDDKDKCENLLKKEQIKIIYSFNYL